jgi:hypothetical protein
VWEYIGDPGFVDATWFGVESRPWYAVHPNHETPNSAYVLHPTNDDVSVPGNRAIDFAHRLAHAANTGSGSGSGGGTVVLFPPGVIPGHFINKSEVIVAGRSLNATVFQALREEPVFSLDPQWNYGTFRFGLRDLGIRGLFNPDLGVPGQNDPIRNQHGVYWRPAHIPHTVNCMIDTAHLERVKIRQCGGFGFAIDGLGPTFIAMAQGGTEPPATRIPTGYPQANRPVYRFAQHVHVREFEADWCLRSGIAFQGICFESSIRDAMVNHCGSLTDAAVAFRRKTHAEEVDPNEDGLPVTGPLRLIASNLTLNNAVKPGEATGGAATYGRIGLLVDNCRQVTVNGFDFEDSHPMVRVSGEYCFNVALREGSMAVQAHVFSGPNDAPAMAVELVEVRGFDLRNVHVMGPFLKAVVQAEVDPLTVQPVRVDAVSNVSIDLTESVGGDFVSTVELREHVEIPASGALNAFRRMIALIGSDGKPPELHTLHRSPMLPPFNIPGHPANLTTVNLAYAQEVLLRVATPSDSVIVKQFTGQQGNISLRDGQDRVLTGVALLRLVWVQEHELWIEA